LARSPSSSGSAAAGQPDCEAWLSSGAEANSAPASRWLRVTQKLRAYWRVLGVHRVKVVLACAVACCGLAVASLVVWGGGYTMLDQTDPLLPPSWSHPLGTNDEREDVLSKLALGGRQLVVPIAAALATAVLIGGLFGTIAGLSLRSVADAAMDLVAELWESVPKLIIVLAAITYMSYEHYELKVFLVVGLAFSPLLFRAVRDEVGALRTSLFLEASITLGVPRRRILWTHVLKNHALPVLAVEAAVLVGYLLLFDAILSFCRVRQRSEVFTWGSLLGTGIDDLTLQLGAGLKANSMVVWGPFVAMLVVIAVSAIAGDALKALGRSVRASQ
jgi:ABC-type dipeptide/oligopeptide/nickel transport system permease subunit